MAPFGAVTSCRCGWDGQGEHPCHWEYQSVRLADRCPKAGSSRLYYNGAPFSLAGVQPKLSVNETFACDEHWAIFSEMLRKAQERRGKKTNAPG